jgi:two-component system alkaline phosphatase synthesis response regulator PhoP
MEDKHGSKNGARPEGRHSTPKREDTVRYSVLVAEDEETIIESLRFLMDKAGYRVLVARDGPAALRMVEAELPDLMLLDVMMPGCDGFEVARLVRSNPRLRDVRILMLTAKGREIDRRKGFELGVDGYITKPFSTRELVDRVKSLLSPDAA